MEARNCEISAAVCLAAIRIEKPGLRVWYLRLRIAKGWRGYGWAWLLSAQATLGASGLGFGFRSLCCGLRDGGFGGRISVYPEFRSWECSPRRGAGSARRWRAVFGGSPKTSYHSLFCARMRVRTGTRGMGRAAQSGTRAACAPHSHFGVRVYCNAASEAGHVPQGRLKIAQHLSAGWEHAGTTSPGGTTESLPQRLFRPSGTRFGRRIQPSTQVLGYSLTALRADASPPRFARN